MTVRLFKYRTEVRRKRDDVLMQFSPHLTERGANRALTKSRRRLHGLPYTVTKTEAS